MCVNSLNKMYLYFKIQYKLNSRQTVFYKILSYNLICKSFNNYKFITKNISISELYI